MVPKRERGLHGAYRKMKGGWEAYWTVLGESTELYRVVLVVERDQTVCVGTSTSLLKEGRLGVIGVGLHYRLCHDLKVTLHLVVCPFTLLIPYYCCCLAL